MSDFEVEISGEGGNYRVAARSAAGETSAVPVRFPFDDLALGRQLHALELTLLRSSAPVRRLTPVDERPVQEFGRRLFEFAFPPELRAHLLASYQQAAQQGTALRVVLRIGPPELATLPWEFLYDPGEDDYLCLRTPLVRYLDVPRPRRPLTVTPPLRILAMAASPDGLESLDVAHEQRRLTQALTSLQSAGRAQLTWVGGQTWWDLQDALDQGDWHIFHFVGHGALDTQTGEGVLAFVAEDGGEHRVEARDLALLLAEQSSLRLVVLNSCETARASAADRFSSTASVLMRRGIPAVVAMQYEISDQAAIAFARGFYTALAHQYPVDHAVTRARRAIKLARHNTLEWATPTLYLRSLTGTLFDLTDTPVTASTAPSETSGLPSAHHQQATPLLGELLEEKPLPPVLPPPPPAKPSADQRATASPHQAAAPSHSLIPRRANQDDSSTSPTSGGVTRRPQPPEGHLFISYAREDKEKIQTLIRLLQQKGHSTWVDTAGTIGGREWDQQIIQAIRSARALLLMISEESMQSTAVRKEVLYAEKQKVTIIPILLEPIATLPDWYSFHLEYIHRIDASGRRAHKRAVSEILAAIPK